MSRAWVSSRDQKVRCGFEINGPDTIGNYLIIITPIEAPPVGKFRLDLRERGFPPEESLDPWADRLTPK